LFLLKEREDVRLGYGCGPGEAVLSPEGLLDQKAVCGVKPWSCDE
jgi:hypothetical protein